MVAEQVDAARLIFVDSMEKAASAADYILVCVGTPSQPSGAIDSDQLASVVRRVGGFPAGPWIVVLSTALPEIHRGIIDLLPPQQQARYVVHPEFLREGSAVQGYLDPLLTIFGSLAAEKDGFQLSRKLYGHEHPIVCRPEEAARVPEELYRAIRPMLAVSGGSLVLLSTPLGKRGHCFEEWTQGGAAWERIEVKAPECPRTSAEFLEEERRSLGERWYRQEYLCSFEETVDQVFAYDYVMQSISLEVQPLFGGGSDDGSLEGR